MCALLPVFLYVLFFFKFYGIHVVRHLSIRRQRHMCIRDRFLSIAFPGSTTAIEGIEADGKISSANKKYNLAGQRTESKQGIIIMDGKKYIIK